MNSDRLQQIDGSMAESPEVCGGVVMVREKSMMKRSMHGLLRVALVAIFVCTVFPSSSFAAECVNEGDLTQPNGDQLVISNDGGTTTGTAFTIGDTISIIIYTSTQWGNPVQAVRIVDSGGTKVVDKQDMVESGSAGAWVYTYDWDSSGANADYYQFRIGDQQDDDPTVQGGFTLGSTTNGLWYYSDASRTTQTDSFASTDTVYARMGVSACDGDIANDGGIDLIDWAKNKDDILAYGSYSESACSGGVLDFEFTLGTFLTDQEWGAVDVADKSNGFSRQIFRDDSPATPPAWCPSTCTLAAPTVTFSTANQTITTDGGNAVYSYTVTNNDTGGSCGSTTFALSVSDSDAINFTTTRTPTTVTLAEGATSAALTMTVTATTGADLVSNISTLTASEGTHPNGTATRTTDIAIPDSTPPTAGTVTVSPDSGTQVPAAFTITTTFTDAESAVTSCDYTLNGGTNWVAGVVSGAGPAYTCTVSVAGQSDGAALTINMRGTSTGGTTTAAAISRTVDAVNPTVSISVAGSTSGTPVTFTVTFSEAVTGFTVADVTLGGTAGATTPTVSVSGSNYTVDVTGMTADGTITMDIPADSAFDSVGNGNTVATQASTNWISCSPNITALTISATPNPISGPTPGTSTITLTPTGDTVTGAEWSADGGGNWFASGTDYTAPAQSNGSVNITGRATENTCSTLFSATNEPYTLTYDTRTPYIVPGTASSSQFGLDKVRITMPYTGINDDSSASVSVAYDLNGSAQTPVTTDPITGAGPAIIDLGVFAGGDAITNIVVTYADTRWSSAPGNAVQNLSDITIVPWSDNNMLHNSNRFPGTTKHGGDWGTLTGYAGGIMCASCHDKNTGNIKRVKATISYPDGSTLPGGGTSAAVSLLSAEDGTSDFGDDSAAPRGSSNKVCEVCHTYDAAQLLGTKFHAADQQVTTGHYDNADCIKCHEHKLGFAASCDSCHASPPIDASGLVVNGSSPGDATGSATAGKHDKHANTLAYACNTCHTGWETTGEMPKAGQINVGIVTPGNDGGTYDGRAGGGGYNADAGTGTSVTTGGALTCAIYCHGNSIGGTTSTAVWNDAATISCGDCHKGTAPQMQTGALGSHGRHAGDAAGQLSLTCDQCHGTVPTLGDSHMDGLVAWDVAVLSGSTPTYAGAVSGSAGPAPTTYESCANAYCHSDVQNNGGTVISPTFAAPTWGGTVACGDCHGAAVTGRPTTGSHTIHNYTCSTCHNGAGDETASHANDNIDVSFAAAIGGSASYSQSPNPPGNNYGTCSNISCHGAGSPTWGAAGSVACGDCHGTSGAFGDNRDGAPPVDLANLSGSYEVGKHQKHLNVSMGNTTDYCNLCHDGAGTGTAKHADGTVDVAFNIAAGAGATWTDTGVNVAPGGTCGSLDANSCHGGTNWDPALTLNCNACHGFGGTDPGHVIDSRGITGTNCEHCHEVGHPQGTTSANSILIPNNLTVGIDYNSGGIHLLKTISGQTKTTEAEVCWTCHGAQSTPVSEWGVNTDTNAGGANYDFGSLSQSNWVGASWTSANFSYKTAGIQSTHSVSGSAVGPGMDAVADIRCSYCHDVHDRNMLGSDASSGKPWLRGTWMGNPYREDGAPRSTNTYAGNLNLFGAVPRGGSQHTELGGYQIDQNNGSPTNGWTLSSSAGICTICHGTDVDNMNEFGSATTDWVGTNGHSNAVIGGTGTNAANIFDSSDRNPGGVTTGQEPGNPSTAYMSSQDRGFGFRSIAGVENEGWDLSPNMNHADRPYGWNDYDWGATVDAGTTDPLYHKFSCSKCHNPHASRLPRLMITNCLDTNHNSWDTKAGVDPLPTGNALGGYAMGPDNAGVTFSNATSAQNCHRVADPQFNNSTGAGWNNVTPWVESPIP